MYQKVKKIYKIAKMSGLFGGNFTIFLATKIISSV